MHDLHRLTTEYIDNEDRIRIVGETAGGNIVTLWLTRRLLDRLIPHLTLWLEKKQGDLPRADLMLEFAQQQAQSRLVPQAPVKVADTPVHLVQSVDITPGNEQVCLNFKPAEGEFSTIAFATTPLRQWLGILYQAYTAAEWPLTPWPAWMTESASASGKPQATVWH